MRSVLRRPQSRPAVSSRSFIDRKAGYLAEVGMGAIVFFWQERQRLYYLLPDVASAQEMMNELLLARIEARHMHFLAKRGTPLGDLPEASVLQKTDIVPGA